MNTKKSLLIIILVTFFALLLPATDTVQSQGYVVFNSVTARLYPEFVKPSIYTIIEIELREEITLPQALVLLVPSQVQNIYAAYIDREDHLIPLELITAIDGNWKKLQIVTPTNHIYIAYDDPILQIDGDNRVYQFEMLTNYDVESFNLQVHPPDGANFVSSNPPLIGIINTNEEILYYAYASDTLPAGEPFTLELWYIRGKSSFSSPTFYVEAIGEISIETLGRTPQPRDLIIWYFAVAVSLIILVGSYFFWFRKSKFNRQDRIIRGAGIMNPEKHAVFCHECGMHSLPGDSFCRNCGTELRKITPFK